MDIGSLQRAAGLVVAMRDGKIRLDSLPADCRPATLTEALAIQEAAIIQIGESVAGWKVAIDKDGQVMRGAVLASRVWPHPARVPAAMVKLMGVEVEVAFRFARDLPARNVDYSREEVEDAVIAFMAVEIVDSRFTSYRDAPLLDRTADFMSNGGFVVGAERNDWRTLDLGTITAGLVVDGKTIVAGESKHPAGHPLLPAVALVNALRKVHGVKQGQFVTTGTYTGLNFAKPGANIVATLADFGSIELTFTE